jgi:hypothetical protein
MRGLARCCALALLGCTGPDASLPPDDGSAGDARPAAAIDGSRTVDGDAGRSSDAGRSVLDARSAIDGSSAPVCGHPTLCLAWPLAGADDGRTWSVTNYVDHDSGGGAADYHGGRKCTDGHAGTDIAIANFPAMDAGVDVYAAAPGEVASAVDGNPDRNTSCTGSANQVLVRHADGSTALYAHLRSGSVAVSVGDSVGRGTLLGQVGSSGCSFGPHLHFEIRGTGDAVVDPFELDMWETPSLYDTPIGVMHVVLAARSFSGWTEALSPPPSITSISAGSLVHVGVMTGGGQIGSTLVSRLVDPGGDARGENTFTMAEPSTLSFWDIPVTIGTARGEWTVEVLANGSLQATLPLRVP